MLNRAMTGNMYLNLCSFLFKVLITIGFWYQVSEMSARYFRYPVATKTSLELPDRYILHDFDLCFNYENLIGKKTIPTVKNILEKTPDITDLIGNCRVKNPNSYRMSNHDKEDCFQVFNVSKYVVHRDICYSIKYRNRSHEFYYEALSNSVNDTRAVYSIVLPKNSGLRRASKVRPIIYGHGFGHPYLSMTLATGFWFARDSFENSFWSDYFMYKTYFLPYPYETQCLDYGQNNCIHDCLTELSLKEFGEIPYSLMTNQPYDHVQINLFDVHKDRRSREFYMHCSKQICSAKSCNFNYVSTFTFKYHSFNHQSISFSTSTLSSPDTYLYSIPGLSFNEYIIFVMSCAGSWLGVSILGLNPISWYQRKFQKYNMNSVDVFDQTENNVKLLRKTMLEMEHKQKLFIQKLRSLDRTNKDILELLGKEFVL